MSHSPSGFRHALRKVVKVMGGSGTADQHTPPAPGSPAAAAPPISPIIPNLLPPPWGPIDAATGFAQLTVPDGSIRIVPPRAEVVPGSGLYPAAPPAPQRKGPSRTLPRNELEYCPHRHLPEHPRKWDFPASLDNPSCRWLQVLKSLYADPLSFPSSLAPEAGLLVHALVRNIRPRIVVETGTFIGMSTIWIAAALAENGDGGTVHTFDDFSPIERAPWRDVELLTGRLEHVAGNLLRAGLERHVVIHPGNSSFELRAAHAELRAAGGAQLAFLDADHGVFGAWHDFWAAEPILNTGGFILLHDTFPEYCSHDGHRHVLDHLPDRAIGAYEKVDMYLAPMNYGLGLIRRVG